MSGVKRPASEQDPDYEVVHPHQEKRQRLYEDGAKEATIRRIENIIRRQFTQEIQNKEAEIMLIDERLNQARIMADRLRACIVASFYSRPGLPLNQGTANQPQSSVHPAVKKHLGKTPRTITPSATPAPPRASRETVSKVTTPLVTSSKVSDTTVKTTPKVKEEADRPTSTQKDVNSQGRISRFKVQKRIIVGNVSKYIPVDKREDNDRSTHRWMVYVRGPSDEPHIDHFVDKVWFFLHPSYKPHDLVEIRERPFHLTRRGWGEFPVRVQLHFKDTRNKRVDIIHNLKLDRTYTGLQTLGAETVVDIELERDSIGLPKPPTLEAEMLDQVSSKKSNEENTTCSAKFNDDLTTEAVTMPLNGPSSGQGIPQGSANQGNIDLSIVKTEPSDASEPEMIAINTFRTKGGSSPVSPPRPGTVTPVKMVFGALGTSPARVTSPASGATTPVKEGSGWTRIQIKSEPISPRASPVSKKGWQNITTLTSPIKAEIPSAEVATPGTVVVKSEPTQVVTSSPSKLILTPGGGIAQLAQGQRIVGQGQSKRSIVTGQVTASNQPVTLVSQSPGSLLRTPNAAVIQGQGQGQVMNVSPMAGSLITTPTSTAVKQSPQQPTVYIRCRDNTGKVYLIPQHVLNKTSAAAATPPTPKSSQVQRVSTPLGMAILSPGGGAQVQTANQGNIAMGAVQALASLAATQRTAVSQASTPSPKLPSMTTTIKNAGKTATLTYVLATTGGTATTPTLTAGSQGQKMVTALQPGHSQGLVLASAVNQGQGQSLILTTQSGQRSHPGTPLNVSGSKTGLQVTSRASTPVTSTASATDAGRSLLMSPSLTENVRIMGGNIVSGPPKASNIVLINPPLVGQSIAGVASSPASSKAGNVQTGGVSLLTGLAGVRPAAAVRPKPGLIAQPQPRLPATGVSLLNRTSPASVRQVSPGTVIIKQEPKLQPGRSRPVASTPTLVSAPRAGQLLLVPAAPAPSPAMVVEPGKKCHQAAAPSSLLTTIGNHKVIVQLVPPQGSNNQSIGQKVANHTQQSKSQYNAINSLTGGGDGAGSKFNDGLIQKGLLRKALPAEKPITLARYHSLEGLLRAVVRWYPVVKSGADRSLHPYCAESDEEFLGWRIGKRRAAEWCRAAAVQRRIRTALEDGVSEVGSQGDGVRFHGELLWSKKRIMWWCRYHAYTPWEQGLHRFQKKDATSECDHDEVDLENDLSTFSDAGPLIDQLTNDLEKQKENSDAVDSADDEEIDIICCDMVRPVRKVKREAPSVPAPSHQPLHLDPSATSTFVHEVAAQIGVRTRPVEVDKDAAPGVYANAVDDMIMAVTKTVMSDVLRKARALHIDRINPSDEIKALHILNALKSISVCDILTLSGLGVLSENGTAEKITPTTHPPA